MTSRTRRPAPPPLSDAPAARPEWQVRLDEARTHEIEKTRLLRAARLAAQAKVPAPSRAAGKPAKVVLRARRAS
jgi:hypothetical protein